MGYILHAIAILCIVAAFVMTFIAVVHERRDFNDGVCPRCGKVMRHFDTDSQGGRGYCCDMCNYHTWVSYRSVDRKYRKM